MKIKYIAILIVFSGIFKSYGQTFKPIIENVKSSFRGMSTVGNNIIWVSGSRGTVGLSKDQGKTWMWVNPRGYETLDFRSIHAFSEKEAVIANAGTPATILRTKNSGLTWEQVYLNRDTTAFIDAITFVGKEGFALGDPKDGVFQLLKSHNKGKSWQDVSHNFILFADEGEAAFAASGSSIKMFKDRLYVGTGGKYASFFNYYPKGLRIDKYDVPIWSGEPSTGIFAIDFITTQKGIAVGGNYLEDRNNKNNILLTFDGGETWTKPNTPVKGYRSDILYITDKIIVATGTSGTDISYDAGYNWINISTLSFNTIAKSKNNKIIYLTGSKGNIYQLIL